MKRTILFFGCVTMVFALLLGRILPQPSRVLAQEAKPPAVSSDKNAPATEQNPSTSKESPTPAAPPTDAKEIPFRLSLLTLKGEWQDAQDADQIKQDLQAGLAGSGVSEALLGGLPESGAKIFFSQDTLSTFAPQKFAQLNAWLASKKLVVAQVPVALKLMGYIPDPRSDRESSPAEKRTPASMVPWALGIDQAPQAGTDAPVYQGVFEVDPVPLKLGLPPVVDEPFLARRHKLVYRITLIRRGSSKTTFARIDRDIFVEEKPRGGKPRNALNLESHWFAVQIPQHTVVLANAFAADLGGSRSSHSQWDTHDVEPVLVFEDDPQMDANQKAVPTVALPDSAAAIDRERENWSGAPAPISTSESAQNASTSGSIGVDSGEPPNSSRRKNRKPPVSPNDEPGAITNAYDLKYVDPETALEIVKKLMPPVHVATVNAGNMKKLIVSGDSNTLEKVKELILILDAPAPTIGSSALGASSVSLQELPARSPPTELNKPISAASLDQLRRAADDMESRTFELANKVRQLQTKQPSDAQRVTKLEQELTKVVAAAFRSRQELLQSEVASLQQRAQGIQRSIEARNRVAKQIVDRRVADLLNPDVNWEATETKPIARPDIAGTQRNATAGDPALQAQEPVNDSTRPPTTSVFPMPSKAEELTLQATLLEMDTSASKELFDRTIQTNAPTMLAIPKDFDSRLKEIAKTANVQIVSKPTIKTHLNQSAVLEIGQTVPVTGAQPDNPAGKPVDVQLEFFPTRRADSALLLELSAQVADGSVASHKQLVGNVRLPTTNVQNFRVVLGVPPEKEVLFVCPSYRPDAARMLLLRVQFEVPGVESSPDLPAPTATAQQTAVVAVNGENGPVLRNAAQYRKLLDDSTGKVNEAQEIIDGLLAEFRKEKPETQLDEVKKVHPKLFDKLERARRDQQLARDELDTQIKLLQIELQDAESELAAATIKYKNTDALYEKKVVSQAERDLERRSVDQAQNRAKKAKVLLDLYQKIDPPQPKDVPGADR